GVQWRWLRERQEERKGEQLKTREGCCVVLPEEEDWMTQTTGLCNQEQPAANLCFERARDI
ncbi:hypothetical protein JOQ06_011826, partial [Pogonophryne albipinna]